jgi:hypothetical protein
VARYRHKSEDDLHWNRVRRGITRAFDTEIQNWREEKLNVLLSEAWEVYTKSLESGELVEVEAKYTDLVRAILSDLTVPRELANGS